MNSVEEQCGYMILLWDGEYEGECELPEGHDDDHFDGTYWYDDDANLKDRNMTEAHYRLVLHAEDTENAESILGVVVGALSEYLAPSEWTLTPMTDGVSVAGGSGTTPEVDPCTNCGCPLLAGEAHFHQGFGACIIETTDP